MNWNKESVTITFLYRPETLRLVFLMELRVVEKSICIVINVRENMLPDMKEKCLSY